MNANTKSMSTLNLQGVVAVLLGPDGRVLAKSADFGDSESVGFSVLDMQTMRAPEKWNAEAERLGIKQSVFCSSLADWADNAVPDQWRLDLAAVIRKTKNLLWLLLTKRIGNATAMLAKMFPEGVPDNVWIGATICNQEEADRDIPKLLAVPAAKRFLSMEPLLGPVDLRLKDEQPCTMCVPWNCELHGKPNDAPCLRRPDWVIVGGESGPKARPMHPDWARSLRDQCLAAGVPFLFKQWGNWRAAAWFDGPDSDNNNNNEDDFVDLDRTDHLFVANDGRTWDTMVGLWDTMGGRWMYPPLPLGHWCLMVNEGKKAAGRSLDGREWNEVPSK
jgi:protein gp37